MAGFYINGVFFSGQMDDYGWSQIVTCSDGVDRLYIEALAFEAQKAARVSPSTTSPATLPLQIGAAVFNNLVADVGFVVGQFVLAVSGAKWMFGQVTAYSNAAGGPPAVAASVTISVSRFVGAGSATGWTVIASGPDGIVGPSQVAVQVGGIDIGAKTRVDFKGVLGRTWQAVVDAVNDRIRVTAPDPFGDTNARLAQAVPVTLDGTALRVQRCSFAASGLFVTLPDATLFPKGWEFTFSNEAGAPSYGVRDNAGTLKAVLGPGAICWAVLVDNSTPAGIWALSGSGLEPGLLIANDLVSTSGLLATGPVVTLSTGQVVSFYSNGSTTLYASVWDPATRTRGPLTAVTTVGGPYVTFAYATDQSRIVAFSPKVSAQGVVLLLTISGNTVTVTNSLAIGLANSTCMIDWRSDNVYVTDAPGGGKMFVYGLAVDNGAAGFQAVNVNGATLTVGTVTSATTSPLTNVTSPAGQAIGPYNFGVSRMFPRGTTQAFCFLYPYVASSMQLVGVLLTISGTTTVTITSTAQGTGYSFTYSAQGMSSCACVQYDVNAYLHLLIYSSPNAYGQVFTISGNTVTAPAQQGLIFTGVAFASTDVRMTSIFNVVSASEIWMAHPVPSGSGISLYKIAITGTVVSVSYQTAYSLIESAQLRLMYGTAGLPYGLYYRTDPANNGNVIDAIYSIVFDNSIATNGIRARRLQRGAPVSISAAVGSTVSGTLRLSNGTMTVVGQLGSMDVSRVTQNETIYLGRLRVTDMLLGPDNNNGYAQQEISGNRVVLRGSTSDVNPSATMPRQQIIEMVS